MRRRLTLRHDSNRAASWRVWRALALIGLLLAACGPAPVLPTPAVTPTSPAATALPTPRPTAAPPVTAIPQPVAPPSALVLWAVAGDQQLEALKVLIGELSQQIGAPIAVVGKSADGLHADLRANALGGLPPPDMIVGSQDDLGILQREDVLQSADDGLDAGGFIPATIEGATIGGQRWGTPLAAEGFLLLLYNQRLVDRPPGTTDELLVRARQLTSGDHYGIVSGWAEPRWFVAWLTGFGGAALAADGTPSLDTPQMVAALNLLRELRASGPPPPNTYAEGAKLFAQGRAAFAIDGDWSLADYRQYTDTLDLGIAPLPVVPATGRVAAPALAGTYLMYSKALAGTQLEQAHALGVALTRPDIQARFASAFTRLPALRAALTDPAVSGNPVLAAAAAQLEGAPGLPPTKNLRCAWNAIGAELPPVLLGELPQENAGQLMQSSAAACTATAP